MARGAWIEDRGILDRLDWLLAVVEGTDALEIAATVEKAIAREGRRMGRPVEYPAFVGALHMIAAGGITGSHRSSSRMLASARVWSLVRDSSLGAHGIELPEEPPTLNHLKGWKRRFERHLGLVHDACRRLALELAMEAGALDTNATSGGVSGVVYADGTVVKAPLRGKTIEKWQEEGKRIDAGLYKENGEDGPSYAIGTKMVLLGVRAGDTRNARIILDVAHLPHRGSSLAAQGYGGEAGVAAVALLALTARAAEHGGRVHTVCYDGALRGVHINALMRVGTAVLSPVHAQSAKQAPFELVQDCPCGRKHQLVSEDGELHEQLVLVTGEAHTKPLIRKRLHRRPNSQGCAWYVEFKLACGNSWTTRIDTEGDQSRKSRNVSERVRQHPPESPLYEQRYGRREESESTNNVLDRTLYGGRMTAFTADRQILVMLGFMIARNTLARHALSRTRQTAA